MLYQSDDFGTSWKKIGTDLPKEPINVIKEDPSNAKILYLGTDHGAYISINQGKSFMSFGKTLPKVAVHDLVIQPRDKDVIIGTHGRSIYVADISILQEFVDETMSTLKICEIDKVIRNKNWGEKPNWHWNGFNEPSVTIPFLSKTNGTGSFSIRSKDQTFFTEDLKIDAGVNYFEYQLNADSTLINGEDNADLKESENGIIYLNEGEFEVVINITDGPTEKTVLIIEAPQTPKKRKGSD